MSTEVPEDRAPELLSLGARPPTPRRRRLRVALIVVAALAVAGAVVWRLLPQPAPDFGLSDLEDVYAGMVRSDGTNDASVLLRENASSGDASVAPAECLPLFEATTLNRFPAEAIDGVGTYWTGGPAAISLFTLRFADDGAARRTYSVVTDALQACAGRPVSVTQQTTTTVRLAQIETQPTPGADEQVAYTFTTGADTRFAVHLFLLSNTVSWQFRYDTDRGSYSPVDGQRLSGGLVSQMRAVQELMRSRPR